MRGAAAIENLKAASRILISEGCTHHRQCGDIGTVKLPAWIRKHTGKDFEFEFTSGRRISRRSFAVCPYCALRRLYAE